jgi:hypothetical protein
MIQAAPLVLSFARAVPMLNKLVGAVGITELGNRVNNYIQENPEESEKIVSMIMPAQGIANALKNKSSEDVEEVEETEEVTTGSGVEERIREILREAGVEDADNQDLTDLPKDLEAKVMSGIAKSSTDRKKDMIEASAIIGLSGPGREKKIMIDEVAKRYDEGGVEEVGNPKFNFTKFYKNRRRKADGGSIGIEVLFENKNPRQGLFMGGSPLDGQALAIYNSMKAYNFSDQEIANALSAQGLYTAPGSGTPETTTPNIIGSQINQGGGDGPKGDFGIFGNLLKDTAKEFNVQFYDEEYGDFIDTPVTGYKNVNTGLYQDKFGKNLQPMFSNKGQAFGISGIIAQALGLTPDTVGGYVPGSVKGKYDGVTDMFSSLKNFKIKNPFNFFKNQQATNAEIAAANLKAKQELEAKLAAEAAAAALQQQMQNTGVTGSNYNQAANIAGGGGGNTATYGGQTAREATYDNDKSTGTSQGYSQHYARGGLVTMFKEKR